MAALLGAHGQECCARGMRGGRPAAAGKVPPALRSCCLSGAAPALQAPRSTRGSKKAAAKKPAPKAGAKQGKAAAKAAAPKTAEAKRARR